VRYKERLYAQATKQRDCIRTNDSSIREVRNIGTLKSAKIELLMKLFNFKLVTQFVFI
jgi:hypothetical protein